MPLTKSITNFDKITESPKTLAQFLYSFGDAEMGVGVCGICRSKNGCGDFDENGIMWVFGQENCINGIENWLLSDYKKDEKEKNEIIEWGEDMVNAFANLEDMINDAYAGYKEIEGAFEALKEKFYEGPSED